MEQNWITSDILMQARERMVALEKEAQRQQLLKALAGDRTHFLLFRKAMQLTGNLLIALGTWLNRRATPKTNGNLPTLAGRFSSIPQ